MEMTKEMIVFVAFNKSEVIIGCVLAQRKSVMFTNYITAWASPKFFVASLFDKL